MLRNKIAKFFYNPFIGISPLFVFSILILSNTVEKAVDISLAFSVIIFGLSLWLAEKRIFQFFSLPTMITLLIFNSLYLFVPTGFLHQFPVAIVQCCFFVCLAIMKLLEQRIHRFIDNNLKISLKISLKPAMQIFFFVSKLFFVFIPVHLLVTVLHRAFYSGPNAELHIFIIRSLLPLLIIVITITEYFNLRWMGKQIQEERFVPVVDDNSRVVGHIALSESLAHHNKFLHPLVRVLIKYDGKLYLKERPTDYPFEPCTVCLPLEDYINYGENVQDAVKRLLHKHFGKVKLNPRFILKYVHETADRKTLNYLYMLPLENDKILKMKYLKGGKLWTEQQIVDNMGKKFFSNAFETEFEYIQSTVLLAEKYD
ncbi:MAG: hypothetical protein Q8909_11775 [Bacteroidota bacterium]|nr:hypothetical protein [Bacteroidota bacterium]